MDAQEIAGIVNDALDSWLDNKIEDSADSDNIKEQEMWQSSDLCVLSGEPNAVKWCIGGKVFEVTVTEVEQQ